MAGEVTIGGKKFPKWGVYATVGGGVAVVGYIVYKRKQNASAASSSSSSGTDPVTGLPYSEDNTVDPLTGETYLQEAQQYGSVSAAEAAMSSGGASSYGGFYGSTGTGTSYTPFSSFTGVQTGSNYTSNAEWAQAVTAGLVDIGYTSTDVAAALGNFLAGLPLTSGQAQIVAAAEAEFGPPPAGAPPITLASTTPPAQTGNNPPPSGSGGSTAPPPAPTGGHVTRLTNAEAVFAWNGNGAAYWEVTRTGPGGTVTNKVTVPQATYGGLESGHNYELTIVPFNSAGVAGPAGHGTFKTR